VPLPDSLSVTVTRPPRRHCDGGPGASSTVRWSSPVTQYQGTVTVAEYAVAVTVTVTVTTPELLVTEYSGRRP
jgi:hypothetical protein